MYVILDKNLNRIGQLSLDKSPGSTPFWGDEIDIQLADEDQDETLDDVGAETISEFNAVTPHANTKNWNHTLTSINIPYGYPDTEKIVEGNSLMYRDEGTGHYYVMRLTDITDTLDASGNHYKSAIGVNLAIWDMGHTRLQPGSFTAPNVSDIFNRLLGSTGWILGKIDLHGGNAVKTITFDDNTNAQAQLQSVLQQYDVEVDAYVVFDRGNRIIEKRIDVVTQLGEDKGLPLEYGVNIKGITRTVTDANLYTRLYVLTKDGKDISDANGGVPFVEDASANQKYVNTLTGEGSKFLEGTIQSQTISNTSAARDWAKNQLTKFNHPRYNYTVDGYFNANLGDTIHIKDLAMKPALTVRSRVIQKKISQADPTQNQCVVGEFATIIAPKSALIEKLQNMFNSKILGLINEIKSGKKTAVVQLITPNGKSWDKSDNSKTVIARVFVDGTNITSYLSQSAFIWTKTNTITGVHDLDWEAKHQSDGYQVNLDTGDVGNITCTIEGDYLKDTAELSIGADNQLVWDKKRVDLPKDYWGDQIKDAFQYQWYDSTNQTLITSIAYDYGTAGQNNRSNTVDTKYHRFKTDGTYIDSMIVQGGGHGSSFGCHIVNGVPEIWTCATDTSGNNYGLCKFTWKANSVVSQGNGLSVLAKMAGINGHYFRRISCDFEQSWVLSVMASGSVEVMKMADLTAGKWDPVYSFKIQQFGFNPVGNDQPNFNTMQSNDIHFPYMFINSGDVNGKDPRIISCINVITESEVFHQENQLATFGDQWVNNYFEPETVGFYHDSTGSYLFQGFTMETSENNTVYLHRTLFKTYLSIRDDSKDQKTYVTNDYSGKEDDVA